MSSLVYHAGALGDFITALPAIAAWRRRRAGAAAGCGPVRVVLLGRPAHVALAAGTIDEAWDAGSARFASLLAGRPSPEVRALLADVGSALVFARADAGIVRGLEDAGVRDIVRGDPFPRGRVHIVDHHLSLFQSVELSPEGRLPRVTVPEPASDAERPIVLHPGSGSAAKNWPIDRFAALAARLAASGPLAWVIGPAEEESGAAASLAGAIPGAVAWRGLPLTELARRLARARLFVGNDSGVAHLAAAARCPVVVLFGASDPAVWAPRGMSVTVVGDGTGGMESIGLETVAAACRDALAAEPGGDIAGPGGDAAGSGGDTQTVDRYDSGARAFSERYESVDMSQLYTLLDRYLPPPGSSVLELGCGSGRDAAFLLSRGYDVMAVDASVAMIAEATQLHPELDGRVVHAAVPLPEGSPLLSRTFHAVFSNAMLMHVPDEGLRRTARQIRRLLRHDGVLVISVSVGREGLRDDRDGTGRLFLERPAAAYRQLFEGAGLGFVYQHEAADSIERPGIRWVSLVFRCP